MPALHTALETGFGALQQRAQAGDDATAPQRELAGFDTSAIERLHRILIEAGRAELRLLDTRGTARIRDQNLSSILLGIAGFGRDWPCSGCTGKPFA